MQVILNENTAELVEKRSRFIASIFYVSNENEAVERLNEIKKKYYDAKHNCYAYRIGYDEKMDNPIIEKSSDDGEPSGTAGRPMIDILKGNNLTNCIAIVTRYFGGILLGTGGLVRAYSDSLKESLKNASFSQIEKAYEVEFSITYDEYSKLENMFNKYRISATENIKNIYEISKNFLDVINVKYLLSIEIFDKLQKELSDITKGRVNLLKNKIKIFYIDKNYDIINI